MAVRTAIIVASTKGALRCICPVANPMNASDAVAKKASRKNSAKNSSVSGRLNQYDSSNLKTVQNMSGLRERGGADAVQIHILEIRLDRREAFARHRLAVDVNHRITGHEAHGDDVQRRLESGELGLGRALAPDVTAHLVEHVLRIALKNDAPLIDDRHAAAQLADVLDDVRRENDDHGVGDLREE